MHDAIILLVDDDTLAIRALSKALNGLGQIRFATSGEEGLRIARESFPDLVILDSEMPGMSGFQVCDALKKDPVLEAIPVIFITSHSEGDMEEAGLALGAVDFIAKPIRPAIVAARVRTHLRLKQALDRLNVLAQTDGLTGLSNRRTLDAALERECVRASRGGSAVSLVLLDIDFFKRYNDTYGHIQGDQCLVLVSAALRRCAKRAIDVVARYGGEEFALLLPDTGPDGAWEVAEHIHHEVARLGIPHSASDKGQVSVSIGVASFVPAESAAHRHLTPAELLKAADAALYEAKTAGRACSRQRDVPGEPATG